MTTFFYSAYTIFGDFMKQYKPLFWSFILPIILILISFLCCIPFFSFLKTLLLPPLPPFLFLCFVWLLCFCSMSYATYQVYQKERKLSPAIFSFLIAMILMVLLPIIFFILKDLSLSFLWSFVDMLIFWYVNYRYFQTNKYTGWYMIPYSIYSTFIFYLAFAIFMLN